jgi:hypothetical protein
MKKRRVGERGPGKPGVLRKIISRAYQVRHDNHFCRSPKGRIYLRTRQVGEWRLILECRHRILVPLRRKPIPGKRIHCPKCVDDPVPDVLL